MLKSKYESAGRVRECRGRVYSVRRQKQYASKWRGGCLCRKRRQMREKVLEGESLSVWSDVLVLNGVVRGLGGGRGRRLRQKR